MKGSASLSTHPKKPDVLTYSHSMPLPENGRASIYSSPGPCLTSLTDYASSQGSDSW